MPIRIFNNIPSLNAQRLLGVNNDRLSKSIERISSGLRINHGSDDAAGLAISQSLNSDTTALSQAVRNSNDGISLLNVSEGALNEQSSILIRLRELASQSATGTVGSTQRQTIQLEFNALRSEIDRIAGTTAFNGQSLIDGSLASSVSFSSHLLIQVGIDNTANSRIDLNTQLNLGAITSSALVTTAAGSPTVTAGTRLADLSLTTAVGALTALAAIQEFLGSVTAARGKIGAVQNRLSHSIANLSVTIENLTSAESSISDADIASETATLTRNQILVQASTAMVGQANLLPQSVLQLLR